MYYQNQLIKSIIFGDSDPAEFPTSCARRVIIINKNMKFRENKCFFAIADEFAMNFIIYH
jgi:hypothetical protein